MIAIKKLEWKEWQETFDAILTNPDIEGTYSRQTTVTPAQAKALLEFNAHNRPANQGLIRRYQNLMHESKWMLNCDAIGFDCNGVLVNGQHRLLAIAAGESEQPALFVFGLHPNVFEVSDVGKKRSAADTLAIEGYQNYALLAALAKIMYGFHDEGQLNFQTLKVTAENSEILDIVKTYPGLVRVANLAGRIKSTSIPAELLQGRLIAFALAAYGEVYPMTESWIRSLTTGNNLSERDPILLLRNRFLNETISRTKLPPEERLALLVTALNLKSKGEKRSNLKWTVKPDAPLPQPIVGIEEIFRRLES